MNIFHIKRNGFALLSFFPLVLLLVLGRLPARVLEAFSLEFFAKHFFFKQGLKIVHIKRNGFALLSFFPLVLLLVFL